MATFTRAEIGRLDIALQVRLRMDAERVERFATLYLDGQDLPPVTVYDTDTGMVLTDGYHRVKAFRQIAREPGAPERLPYVLHAGSRAEARLHALSANDSGSLPLTPEDRVLANLVEARADQYEAARRSKGGASW